MKFISKHQKLLTYLILTIVIIFNAYLFRNELKITTDANDNSFQYALVDEANKIWKNVFSGKLPPFYLIDSFNERWNEGFSLSTYYSHLPQALIALFGFIPGVNLYQFFNLIKFLILIFVPVSFFIGARILGLSYLYGILSAILSQLIFTDGLYGIDITNYLWRGWGLSSQLFALFILPLAFAYAYSYLENNKNIGKAILFNFAVAQTHWGVFYMLALSYGVLIFFHLSDWRIFIKRLLTFSLVLFFLLSYYIIPFFIQGNYRNFSYWDPLWKFDSLGIKQILEWLGNGVIFDFGRFSVISLLVGFGIFWAILSKKRLFHFISVLFFVYLVLFFGRSSLGKTIGLLPGLSEFHLHRFIVMVQIMGIYLAVGFITDAVEKIKGRNYLLVSFFILATIIIFFAEKPIINYAQDNNKMIDQFNQIYRREEADYQKLVNKLKSLPKARIYAGRPGNWGRQFQVGGSQLYMSLAEDGFPVIGFAPESWSPNSEFDQFFDEQNLEFYNLYNVGYLIASSDFKQPKFARLIEKIGKFYLYGINTDGWFSFGMSNLSFSGNKTDFVNIIHLWQMSPALENHQYPKISFGRSEASSINLKSASSYLDVDGKTKTLWENNLFLPTKPLPTEFEKISETILPNGYKTSFKLLQDCPDCIATLKNTFHPNWQVLINGKKINSFPIFPFYIGIPIERAGVYEVVAVYRPNALKTLLLWVEIIIVLLVSIKYLVSSIKNVER